MLFVAFEGKSRLIDLKTKTVHKTCTTSHVERRGLTYCASSMTVVAHQSKGCTSFFSPCTQQPVQRSFTSETITCSVCTSDGVFLVGGTGEGNIYVWNTLSGQLFHLVRAHTRCVTDIAMSSDQSLIVTASEDSVCKTWTLASLVARGVKTPAPHSIFNGHTLAVNACSFMESGYLVVTGSADRTCRIFDGLTGRQQFLLTVEDALTSVRSSPGGEMLLLGSASGSLFFVSLYTDTAGPRLPTGLCRRNDDVVVRRPFEEGHSGAIVFIWFDAARPDYAIVGSANGAVLWWNTATRAVQSEALPRLTAGVLSICYVPREAASLHSLPCTGIAKHPLDPCGTDYAVVAVTDGNAATRRRVAAGSRRRRRLESCGADIAGDSAKGRDDEKEEDAEATEPSAGSGRCRIEDLRCREEKNNELETLRDRLKEKLQKLEAS
ncbi:WD40 repeat-containing protein [Trypanosoma grayi]|uniref:WD40 repeat-containing protein n=1 Tax=Trypanosoma grayi TaxID=71804 RepID=UPI0004F4BDA6|nr:WD40 repeat-containing protein [Trypanosoma grayi]KEG11416.1 WD40 repeat-containing protein [Trypanosoma grayi]